MGHNSSKLARELFLQDFDFKVIDQDNHMHKVRCLPNSLVELKAAVAGALGSAADSLLLKYIDEDKDEIVLSSDQVLYDAVTAAKSMGSYALKITASSTAQLPAPPKEHRKDGDSSISGSPSAFNSNLLVVGGIVAIVAMVALVFTRK